MSVLSGLIESCLRLNSKSQNVSHMIFMGDKCIKMTSNTQDNNELISTDHLVVAEKTKLVP